jgi:transposase
MAVRGLGCPVAFHLTGGNRGDVPQAARLIDGHSAEIVLADAAYDADHFRGVIAAWMPVNGGRFPGQRGGVKAGQSRCEMIV